MVEYFQREEGQREFAEWQVEQGMEILPTEEEVSKNTTEQVA